MEKSYFLILLFLVSALSFGQSKCEDADSDLLYAYSHVKSAYKSNNISHLKYYSKRSLDAFKRSKDKLKACGCETAYDLAYDGVELLARVENSETYEDGRFYVKRAREIAQKSIVELDKFTIPTNEDNLSSLQSEKEKLEQLQRELAAKEAEVQAKLALQEQKETKLKKEQLINAYKLAIANNLETYNSILEICDCDPESLGDIKPKEDLDIEAKSVEEIKLHLLKNIKGLTTNYLSRLDLCDED